MKTFNVGIVGATGMVGQRFCSLLENHPWFRVVVLAASSKSAGMRYADCVKSKWGIGGNIPQYVSNITILDAIKDAEKIANDVDFIFCAVDMDKARILELEELYAKLECPVISNNSAARNKSDVPMIIPEINPEHSDIIPIQRKRLGTKRGFIAVKSNCSIQSYVPALTAIMAYNPLEISVCTYQAISGAGKTFETWPEMLDNVIPYIGGEEEKSEQEPMKIWGSLSDGGIINAKSPKISAQCIRVPVSNGHTAAVFVKLGKEASLMDIEESFNNYIPKCAHLNLPSSPEKFLTYFKEADRPQANMDRDLHNGMGISIGRLRQDNIYNFKFISLSHNTVRGAAGGAVLMAELLCAKGYI